MSLFKKAPKIEQRFVEQKIFPAPKPKKEKLIQIYTCPQNATFKGHKSIAINVRNDPAALEGINHLKIENKNYVFDPATVDVPEGYASTTFEVNKYLFPFKGRLIVLKEYLRDEDTFLDVHVNDYYVGSIKVDGDRQMDLRQALQDQTLASVHVRIETQFRNKVVEEKKKRIIETEEQFKVNLFYKLN